MTHREMSKVDFALKPNRKNRSRRVHGADLFLGVRNEVVAHKLFISHPKCRIIEPGKTSDRIIGGACRSDLAAGITLSSLTIFRVLAIICVRLRGILCKERIRVIDFLLVIEKILTICPAWVVFLINRRRLLFTILRDWPFPINLTIVIKKLLTTSSTMNLQISLVYTTRKDTGQVFLTGVIHFFQLIIREVEFRERKFCKTSDPCFKPC